MTLCLTYLVIVRRFGFLKENQKEWLNVEQYQLKTEVAIPKFQLWIMKMLETKMVESFSMVMIYTYSLFILFDLTVSDSLAIDPNLTAQIDSIFLTFFFIEIGLKTFASSGMFLTDFFNFFDAAIVLTSEVFNLLGITAKGLGVLRLIRVVVLTIRRITGNTSKLRHQNKNLNPVDSVIKILQQIQELPEISKSVQKEAIFAIHLIESNMLYNLNMD